MPGWWCLTLTLWCGGRGGECVLGISFVPGTKLAVRTCGWTRHSPCRTCGEVKHISMQHWKPCGHSRLGEADSQFWGDSPRSVSGEGHTWKIKRERKGRKWRRAQVWQLGWTHERIWEKSKTKTLQVHTPPRTLPTPCQPHPTKLPG